MFNSSYFFKLALFLFTTPLFLTAYGCSKHLLFIESSHYIHGNNYYPSLTFAQSDFTLITIWNNMESYHAAKARISLFSEGYLKKVNLYAVILLPYTHTNQTVINQSFELINNLHTFLRKERNFDNNLYTIGIPYKNTITPQVLIYFKPIK